MMLLFVAEVVGKSDGAEIYKSHQEGGRQAKGNCEQAMAA